MENQNEFGHSLSRPQSHRTATMFLHNLTLRPSQTKVPEILRTGDEDDLRRDFEDGAVYWKGVDKQGRPILWEKFSAIDWARGFDSARKIRIYVLLFEACFAAMPKGVSTFTVVADTSGIPNHRAVTKPSFFTGIAQLFVKAFPDRLGFFLGKSSPAMSFCLRVVSPILPSSVSTKMVFPSDFEGNLVENLADEDDLPQWAGGTKAHPTEITISFSNMMNEVAAAMNASQQEKK